VTAGLPQGPCRACVLTPGDSNRNRAKCRDGLRHFETLNARLTEAAEPWRYHFYFLSPDDFTQFFAAVRRRQYAGWRSGLMQDLLDRSDR
jgi:type III restriction enzyme